MNSGPAPNYDNIEESKDNDFNRSGNDESNGGFGLVNASIYQAAILNKILPRGFRIDLEEDVQRKM